ncbi:hypothetical protein [Stenomitos frigidus]|nr:hypothetical protein [Stenomitos frigidus]
MLHFFARMSVRPLNGSVDILMQETIVRWVQEAIALNCSLVRQIH